MCVNGECSAKRREKEKQVKLGEHWHEELVKDSYGVMIKKRLGLLIIQNLLAKVIN